MSLCHMWVATMGDDNVQGRHEFRMELMEVGLLGKAVVTVRSPGLTEHGLLDGVEVLYVDPLDPTQSAQKIAAVARNPGAVDQLGQKLRERVAGSFSLSRSVDEILESLAG
jgi:hypothetical protein